MPFRETLLLGFGYREGVRVGSGVSEVQAAFVTTLAAMYLNHADRASRLDRRCLQSRSGISTAYGGGGFAACEYADCTLSCWETPAMLCRTSRG
jgi:hypothetical protein